MRTLQNTTLVCSSGGCTAIRSNHNIFFSLQRNNQTRIVGSQARYTKQTAAANHAKVWDACVPPLRFATPVGYQVIHIPQGGLMQQQYRTAVLDIPGTRHYKNGRSASNGLNLTTRLPNASVPTREPGGVRVWLASTRVDVYGLAWWWLRITGI